MGQDSTLKTLSPALNEMGVMFAETRLAKLDPSLLHPIAKDPIILPKDNIVTTRIVLGKHMAENHPTLKTMISLVRSEYLIINARTHIKKILKLCKHLACRVPTLETYRSRMANLPAIKLQNPFFQSYHYRVVSMDICGAWFTRLNYQATKFRCSMCKKLSTNNVAEKSEVIIEKTWVLVLCLSLIHI